MPANNGVLPNNFDMAFDDCTKSGSDACFKHSFRFLGTGGSDWLGAGRVAHAARIDGSILISLVQEAGVKVDVGEVENVGDAWRRGGGGEIFVSPFSQLLLPIV